MTCDGFTFTPLIEKHVHNFIIKNSQIVSTKLKSFEYHKNTNKLSHHTICFLIFIHRLSAFA